MLEKRRKKERMPRFQGYNQEGKLVSNLDYVGKALVLFFYPKNFTKVCTNEVCAFRDIKNQFQELNADIVGFNNSKYFSSIREFHEENNLNYNLVWDRESRNANRFGVGKTLGVIPNRVTFVFNEKHEALGRYDSLFSYEEHIRFALKTLRRYNESVPLYRKVPVTSTRGVLAFG
ncbi:MAG: peroxiredoxin family protein [Flavobacteriales bacterium]|nr:peroxiredoxin family protein [Flavobacteriales bacterium]